MTGLELLKAPEATAGEIADIISAPCPPTIPAHCDGVSCRACWLSWLTGEPPEEKGPSDEQTAPCGGCPLQGKKRELINQGQAMCPREIQQQAICIDADIGCILRGLSQM